MLTSARDRPLETLARLSRLGWNADKKVPEDYAHENRAFPEWVHYPNGRTLMHRRRDLKGLFRP